MSGSALVLEFRPLAKGAPRGFAQVQSPSGLIINDVSVLRGRDGLWVSPPIKAQIGRDGAVLKDDNGRTRYSAIVEFASREARDRFSRAAVDSVLAVHPEVLS